jgi:hypothetical protein
MGITYLGNDICQETPQRGALLGKRYVASLNDREGFWISSTPSSTSGKRATR